MVRRRKVNPHHHDLVTMLAPRSDRSRSACRRHHPHAKDRLSAAHATVADIPRPVAAIISVRYLLGAYPLAVELDSNEEVGRRFGQLHDLDERSALECVLPARRQRAGMQDVLGDVVKQNLSATPRHAGYY
jgi:hypothetical protein